MDMRENKESWFHLTMSMLVHNARMADKKGEDFRQFLKLPNNITITIERRKGI